MNEDNWQHRSATMRCGFCIYFVPKGAPIAGLGRCRRHAPTLNGWPAVFVSDFCGDHKLDDVVLARAAAEQQSRARSIKPPQGGDSNASQIEGVAKMGASESGQAGSARSRSPGDSGQDQARPKLA